MADKYLSVLFFWKIDWWEYIYYIFTQNLSIYSQRQILSVRKAMESLI